MATAQSPVRLSQKRDRQRFFRGHDSRWKGFPHFRSPHYGCYNSEATGSIHLIVQSFNTMAHHVRSHYYIFLRIHVYAHTILLSQYKHIILCDEWVIVRPSRAVVFCRIGFIPTSIEQMQKTFNSWWHKIHSTRRFSKYLFSFYPKDVIHLNAWAILWSVGAPPRLVMTRARPGRLYLLLWWFNLWSVYTLRCNSLISIHSGSNHNPHQYVPCWTVEQQTSTDIFYIPNNHIINFVHVLQTVFLVPQYPWSFHRSDIFLAFCQGDVELLKKCVEAELFCQGRPLNPFCWWYRSYPLVNVGK